MNLQSASESKIKGSEMISCVTLRTTSKDSGAYMCIATNRFNETVVFTSNSSEVIVTVKG